MIFPILVLEDVLQVNDKTRFKAQESFATPDEGGITAVKISFDDVNFIDVFKEDYPEKWYLDYAFDSDEEGKSVWLLIETTNTPAGTKKEFNFDVITEESDALFSKDSQLISYETEIMDFLPKGKSSFKYAHRNAQTEIVRYLDGQGIRKLDEDKRKVPFEKADLVGNAYISEWSTFLTLLNVFEDIKVKDQDLYEKKKKLYSAKLTKAVKTATLRLDYNSDGETTPDEHKNVQNKFLTR